MNRFALALLDLFVCILLLWLIAAAIGSTAVVLYLMFHYGT